MKRIIVIAVSLILAGPAGAQDTNADQSVIGVKLQFSLSQLENLLDQTIPRQISQPPARHVCVPAERACTKIPEFRGFKIYSLMSRHGSPAISPGRQQEKVTSSSQVTAVR